MGTFDSDARHGLIDVSHTVEDGMITYKGLPAPVICDYLSREESRSHYTGGTEFYIGKIEMVANTGTYIDSPFHRYADGKDLSDLPLTSLADLEGIVVRVARRAERAVSFADFMGLDVRGKAVLVHTGWDAHWRTDQYFEDHPFLTRDAASSWRTRVPRWWGSTRSISTISRTGRAQSTRFCCAPGYPSPSTCAVSTSFHWTVSASLRRQSKSKGLALSRCVLLQN